MKKLPRRIRLVERKLGREKAAGLVWSDDPTTIHIDPRLRGKDRAEIILHEALHLLLPTEPEMRIRAYATRLSDLLWRDRWRRVEF